MLNTTQHPGPKDDTARILLVMLPGAGDCAQDFVDHGFIKALHSRHPYVDAVAVDMPTEKYLDRIVVEQLAEEVIQPQKKRNRYRVWLMGISLGGMGVLSYLRKQPHDIDGAILLAPFLGTRGLIAEISRAGGLDRWCPGNVSAVDEERLLVAWLKSHDADETIMRSVYLAYGMNDRFAAASKIISERLSPQHVITEPGGHDWPTWKCLWHRVLECLTFQERAATQLL
jgi:pimeloyl-ACP methyl ester carboxylesterase